MGQMAPVHSSSPGSCSTNGVELRVVQELLGHTNPNTTQIYLHVTEARQRNVMESSQEELAAVEMARRALRQSQCK